MSSATPTPPATGSSSATGVALPAEAVVAYEFHDSSVPPQFHRSYVLTFDRKQAHIVVDSYGDVLADETVDMTDEAWLRVSETLGSLQGVSIEHSDEGCTGGTGFTLNITGGGTADTSLDAYVCGGANVEADDVVSSWVQPVRDLFPPMAQLAPEGAE